MISPGLVAAKAGDAGLPLIYFAGRRSRRRSRRRPWPRPGARSRPSSPIARVIVGDFDADVRAAIAGGRIDGVLHYSARTAGAFIAAARAAGITDFAMKIRHFCLSSQVAAPLAAAGAASVRIAGAPNEAALFALIDMP